MKRLTRWLILSGLVLVFGVTVWTLRNRPGAQTRPVVLAAQPDVQGFERAQAPAHLAFPQDFGQHPNFQTEWWYYTGNLRSADGRRFGYQFTIFRRALMPQSALTPRSSHWAASQVYMGHFALTDVDASRHYAFERFNRGAAGLAGAQSPPYRVWLENWVVESASPATGENTYRLSAAQDGIQVELALTDLKGLVLQGIDGYSQKGPEPGNASYYYSQTRLQTKGEIIVNEERFSVEGASWMDHEYSTSALSKNQVGWDWFALQLDDGTELKVFYLREADGGVSLYSSGSFVDAQGNLQRLEQGDFIIQSTGSWRSPRSKAVYPSGWRIEVSRLDLQLEVTPLVKDQELNVSYSYWEGAVDVRGARNGFMLTGSGYVELTGYAGSMAGEF